MKRFYKEVAVAAPGEENGFSILLDGRPVRTPCRRPLAVPANALARRIADEWQLQEEKVILDAMPLTRLAATAIDRVADQRPAYVAEIAGFAGTDLVCYRAPTPVDLAERQARAWQPLLDWVRETFAADLAVTEGVAPVSQDPDALACMRRAVEGHDDHELAALGLATVASGSLVIALALFRGMFDPDTAFEASQLDETWQFEHWGSDPEAERRREGLRQDLAIAHEYLSLLRAG